MLYSEFLEGVDEYGDALTWAVYQTMEAMFDDLYVSKVAIYQYSKKLLAKLRNVLEDVVYHTRLQMIDAITEALTKSEKGKEDEYEYDDVWEVVSDIGDSN